MSSSGSGADLLGRLADEFLERYRRGERPPVTEYTGRHPELADQIRELFPALVLMEDVRPGPQPAEPPPGADGPLRRLGEYRIVRPIGRGGMGVVYEAEQESLGRRVALKVLPPGALGDARHVERFQREARAAARLHHTNIVPVFGVGEENGTYYYVMQYIEGRPLDEVVRELRRLREVAERGAAQPEDCAAEARRPSSAWLARSLWQGRSPAPSRPPVPGVADPDATEPPEGAGRAGTAPGPDATPPGGTSSSALLSDPERPYANSVAHVGVQAAEALEYAAGQGVLHRDVKPSNLLLDVWGTVWLTDFGLAKASGTPELTRSGDLLGTLRYMAPERFQGRADVRSDVYALGLTLYELLALRPAFGGQDPAELLRHITTAEPVRLDRVNPHLPRDLVTIVHKAMAKDPGERYPTAGALAEDLRRFLDDRSIVARRASLPEQAWRWCRRNRAVAGLLAALFALCLLATGGGVWLVRQQAERRAEAVRQAEELRKEVGTALDQAVSFRKGFHFHQARELLEQARQRLEPAGPDYLRRRVKQARADLNLAEKLDAARLEGATLGEGKDDFSAGERLYAAAFAEAGLGREGDDIAALAARVRGSAVREEILGALDDWASITKQRARRQWLLAVARAADPDPSRDRLRQAKLWQDCARLAKLARDVRVAALSSQLASALGRVLIKSRGDAARLLTAALARFPNDFWLNFYVAWVWREAGRRDEAIGYYRAALALRPGAGAAHNNLGATLHDMGRVDDAIGHFRQALRLSPRSAITHDNLGIALHDKGRLDEAVDHYREALRLDPKLTSAHDHLGRALYDKGRLDEAIGHFRQALRLRPKNAPVHNGLGNALVAKGLADEAIGHFRQALRIDPKNAPAHMNLGNVLHARGRLDDAIPHFQQVLRLDPKSVAAHINLGSALHAKGRSEEAVGHFRQAARLDPKSAMAHNNLAGALADKGRLDEAADHFRQAVRLDPKNGELRGALGEVLVAQGRFREAEAATRRGLELLPQVHALRGPMTEQLQHCRRMLALEARLPAVLRDKDKPASAAEGLEFGDLCRVTKQYAAAARFYADALAADPKLAGDLPAGHRYNAACAAARAGAGQATDAAMLDAKARARWRKQALDWLRADLAAWAKAKDRALRQQRLMHWQQDGDLAAVRDAGALGRLPPAERRAWQCLWADVKALLVAKPK
jgi:tetratricopeptide (TPR) repeat protein/tRNA A-37 threonylcarbamoyl transferase component Bud32